MKNFKGTKGKWVLETSKKGHHWMNVSGKYKFIKVYVGEGKSIQESQKANALLISKAPEMLEMLERAKSILGNVGEFEMAKEIELLIKSATEL